MKTAITILIILSFLQTTVIALDLVLLVLILRAYILNEKANLILAFAFGLLISHLTFTPLGIISIIYLILVQISQSVSKSALSHNLLMVIPLVLVLLSANELVLATLLHQSPQLWPKVMIEGVLSLPIYFVILLWEERFVVKEEIKLKIKS